MRSLSLSSPYFGYSIYGSMKFPESYDLRDLVVNMTDL